MKLPDSVSVSPTSLVTLLCFAPSDILAPLAVGTSIQMFWIKVFVLQDILVPS